MQRGKEAARGQTGLPASAAAACAALVVGIGRFCYCAAADGFTAAAASGAATTEISLRTVESSGETPEIPAGTASRPAATASAAAAAALLQPLEAATGAAQGSISSGADACRMLGAAFATQCVAVVEAGRETTET